MFVAVDKGTDLAEKAKKEERERERVYMTKMCWFQK
jgi:hypothetical protein